MISLSQKKWGMVLCFLFVIGFVAATEDASVVDFGLASFVSQVTGGNVQASHVAPGKAEQRGDVVEVSLHVKRGWNMIPSKGWEDNNCMFVAAYAYSPILQQYMKRDFDSDGLIDDFTGYSRREEQYYHVGKEAGVFVYSNNACTLKVKEVRKQQEIKAIAAGYNFLTIQPYMAGNSVKQTFASCGELAMNLWNPVQQQWVNPSYTKILEQDAIISKEAVGLTMLFHTAKDCNMASVASTVSFPVATTPVSNDKVVEAGGVLYYYNDQDQIVKVEGAGETMLLTYTDGNIVAVEENGETLHYVWNNDQVVSIKDANGNVIEYLYDSSGKVKTETVTIGGKPYAMSYTYDSQGRVAQFKDPYKHTVTYDYDDDDTRINLNEEYGAYVNVDEFTIQSEKAFMTIESEWFDTTNVYLLNQYITAGHYQYGDGEGTYKDKVSYDFDEITEVKGEGPLFLTSDPLGGIALFNEVINKAKEKAEVNEELIGKNAGKETVTVPKPKPPVVTTPKKDKDNGTVSAPEKDDCCCPTTNCKKKLCYVIVGDFTGDWWIQKLHLAGAASEAAADCMRDGYTTLLVGSTDNGATKKQLKDAILNDCLSKLVIIAHGAGKQRGSKDKIGYVRMKDGGVVVGEVLMWIQEKWGRKAKCRPKGLDEVVLHSCGNKLKKWADLFNIPEDKLCSWKGDVNPLTITYWQLFN